MPPDHCWHHYRVEFADPSTAEHLAATVLAPALDQAVRDGELDLWWHLRKTPAWRLRYRPINPDTAVVDTLLPELAAAGHVAAWSRGLYEPETVAFGGRTGMDLAHTLFHYDSRHCLARATTSTASTSTASTSTASTSTASTSTASTSTASTAPGRRETLGQRETTVVLFTVMLRAAGLDWFEQGDVWARVAALRSAAPDHACRDDRRRQAMRRLMTIRAARVADLVPASWWAAFDTAGRQLAALAHTAELERGLRAVLAHHFLFHANRAGLSGTDQAVLAALAVDTVFHRTPTPPAPATTAPDMTSAIAPDITSDTDKVLQ